RPPRQFGRLVSDIPFVVRTALGPFRPLRPRLVISRLFFEFSYHLLPLFVHLPSLFRLLLELPAELGIGTGVQSELAPVQMGHFVRYGVEEPAIVGHY